MPAAACNVCFSNRPFGVKRFQTIHHCGVDVAHGLVLLFGIGTKALVWSFFCQGVRQSGKSFVLRPFLCSISKPVSSSRPAVRWRRRAQELSRLAAAPTLRHAPRLPGHTLTASSTTARLVRSG